MAAWVRWVVHRPLPPRVKRTIFLSFSTLPSSGVGGWQVNLSQSLLLPKPVLPRCVRTVLQSLCLWQWWSVGGLLLSVRLREDCKQLGSFSFQLIWSWELLGKEALEAWWDVRVVWEKTDQEDRLPAKEDRKSRNHRVLSWRACPWLLAQALAQCALLAKLLDPSRSRFLHWKNERGSERSLTLIFTGSRPIEEGAGTLNGPFAH